MDGFVDSGEASLQKLGEKPFNGFMRSEVDEWKIITVIYRTL